MTDIDYNPPKADVPKIVDSRTSPSHPGFSGASVTDIRALSSTMDIPSLPHINLSSPAFHAGLYGGIAGGVLGGGAGFVAEGACQAMKVPLAVGFSMIGGAKFGMQILNAESNYLATASKFGVRGVAVGALVGLTAYGAWELKNYLTGSERT